MGGAGDLRDQLVVIEELDQHKTRMDDVGRAAREVIRTIEELRMANGGDIRHAVELPGGGVARAPQAIPPVRARHPLR